MALPDFTMRQLLDAGVHFGHQTHRWNPKMKPYIFGDRNNVHIIDLAQTVPMLSRALQVVSDTVASGGRVLFVGTKRQASEIIADAAKRSAQYYVNARWLGGMMTNWKTISNSIQRLRKLDEILASEASGFTKKERLNLEREREKLNRALGGIRDMGGTPDLMFIIDTNKESIAIDEAKRLGIPVVASSTPIAIRTRSTTRSGQRRRSRAIALLLRSHRPRAIDGIARQQGASGAISAHPKMVPGEPALEEASRSLIGRPADDALAVTHEISGRAVCDVESERPCSLSAEMAGRSRAVSRNIAKVASYDSQERPFPANLLALRPIPVGRASKQTRGT